MDLVNHYQWEVLPDIPVQKCEVPAVVQKILYNRGYQDIDTMRKFISIDDSAIVFFEYFKPFDLPDMEKAVKTVWDAIHRKKHIVIYGDFDADGVTSTSSFFLFLKKLGANVTRYIPNRFDEGYGINYEALEYIYNQGAELVISVDCGSKSVDEINRIKLKGLKVVVTDHHEVGDTLPDAEAVVNPQLGENKELKGICGAGVAFFLIIGMLQHAWQDAGSKPALVSVYEDILNSFTDLVAIGTVADVMPLNNIINRLLVKRGIRNIRNNTRLGLLRLLFKAGVKAENVTSTTLGFAIGPRINAAGRMDNAMIASDLMIEENTYVADGIANRLEELNKARQKNTRDALDRARDFIEEKQIGNDMILIVEDKDISSGIVGLVAGRLTESYYRPSIVFERGGETSRASCRSIPEFHITDALKECHDILVRYGGHAMAAGLTIRNEHMDEFKSRMLNHAEHKLADKSLVAKLKIDSEVDLSEVNVQFIQTIMSLEPFGHEHKLPLFMSKRVQIIDFSTMGDGKHLKMMVRSPLTDSLPVEAVYFSKGELAGQLPQYVDIVYHAEINEWNDTRRLQLNVQDMRAAKMLL